jgi:hypothetical protein
MVIAKFDPSSLINRIRTLNDPVLGEIKYGVLSVGELVELDKVEDPIERTKRTVQVMLGKAYPEVTMEEVEKMDYDAVIYLMTVLSEASDFRVKEPDKPCGPTPTPEASVKT